MNIVNIAILDDEEESLEKTRRETEQFFAGKEIPFRIQTYGSPKWFVYSLPEEPADIYLLDIEMEQMSGLEVARKLRERYPDPVLIFITNHVEYAIPAFEVNTYRYIPKAQMAEMLPKAYESLLPLLENKDMEYYAISKGNSATRLYYKDIYYLKKEGKYVVFISKGREARVRDSLIHVYKELNSDRFLMIDKSYVVNIQHVMQLYSREIIMRNQISLPVSAPRIGQVRRAVMDYWGK